MGTQVWASVMSWREYYRLPHPKSASTLLGDVALSSPRFHQLVGSWLYENGGIVATRFLWFKVLPLSSNNIIATFTFTWSEASLINL